MEVSYPNSRSITTGVHTGRGYPSGDRHLFVRRLITDPIFIADITIEGAIIGSRFLLMDNNFRSVVLQSGVITSSSHTLTGVPVFTTPNKVLLRLRKSSISPIYRQLELVISHFPSGTSVTVSQELDE